ncbi:hypothetical protein A1Q2_02648 [Trichosporon asahii var. asahii CBS 8904]|uniref:DASH complex subunit DAD1 n=2 Tax=Trichosporon asahii var. asahii TaxID=189963 RepID=K1VR05_TRIAC|nr:hypothetical protein A1Q1_07307 [Trichosporon asahii var. asahii CBS 2479]EJT51466.1 hypothetical protein A1Q1_07307 [Trichosporon asahii var. asahii CBS 2479]EKD03046.1 hypothetical protein A1Q2_02648 [Trichosporon asahii var. asahii CBS 8904]
MNKQDPAESFFEMEKQRLIGEINSDVLSHTNALNRKLEEVDGVGKEFNTVAELWSSFLGIVNDKANESYEAAVPGTGTTNFGASTQR